MKRLSAFAAILLLCLPCLLIGCKKADTPEVLYNPGIKTDEEAINYVLNYVVNVQENGETTSQLYAARIAGETLGFANFYNPKYGAKHAEQNPDGSITVTAEGSMSGEFANGETGKKVFTLTAVITSKTEPPKITIKETASL